MVSRFTFTLATIALCASLAACSDPRKTALPADLKQIEAIKPQIAKLPEDERGLLMNYVVRRTMSGLFTGGLTPPEMAAATIGEAIAAERAWEAKEVAEKLETEKRKAEAEAVVQNMREQVKAYVLNKRLEVQTGYNDMELDRKLHIAFVFENKSTKDIAGIKGRITAKDMFGDALSAFQISIDDPVKAGGNLTWSGSRSTRFALGGNKDEKLAELADDKYTIAWEPQMVIFADGTKMEAPK